MFVTGVGAWTPFGLGFEHLWQALIEARPAFAPVGSGFGPDPQLLAGRITDLKPFRAAFPKARPPLPIPVTRVVLAAAREACLDAALESEARAAAGVILNRNRGPAQVVAKIIKPVFAKGVRKTSPLLFSQSVANAPLGAVATQLGLRGPQLQTMGGGALLAAHDALRCGEADALVVGGFEELVSELFEADIANGVIDARRELEDWQRGPLMSEGCACVVLETRAHLEARGATPRAQLLGVERGLSLRAVGEDPQLDPLSRWGHPSGEGFASMAERSLAAADISPSQVDYHASNGALVPAFTAAEEHLRAQLGIRALMGRGRCGSLDRLLGEAMGMGAIAKLAWVATMLAEGELTRATTLGPDAGQPGTTALPQPANILLTHLDAHASQLSALVRSPV